MEGVYFRARLVYAKEKGIIGVLNTTARLNHTEATNMNYGDLTTNEFRDDEPELNNQIVFVEDDKEISSELSDLIDRYEGY